MNTPDLGRPRVVPVPKLAVSATFSSMFYADGDDGTISAMVFVHVTDSQGYELPPEILLNTEDFQLFMIDDIGSLVPVPHSPLAVQPVHIGALAETVYRFNFNHALTETGMTSGQLRTVPFMLVVSPDGTRLPALAGAAGTTLLSFAVIQP